MSFIVEFTGSWKREKWGVEKEANVRLWFRTVAIEVGLQFENGVFEGENDILFSALTSYIIKEILKY
jgi:hypothetical protein